LARGLGISLALMMGLVMAGGSAMAEISSDKIGQIMKERNYAVAEISDTMVAVDAGDFAVIIAVNGSNGDISYLTYLKGVSSDMVGYEFLNRFNNGVKFGRAYIDGDGDIAIQMDRNSDGGVTLENIESDFDVFVLLVNKFMRDLTTRSVV
jgi:Putative bacterial sensory transduction regulator